MQSFAILDDYELQLGHAGPSSLVAQVVHVARPPSGQTLHQVVGHVSAFEHPGDNDSYKPHWKLELFLIDQYEYDEKARVTVTAGLMERDHWRSAGIEVQPGTLPPYHPQLPKALAETVLREKLCTEPLWVHVHHAMFQRGLEFGEINWDD